MPVVDNSVENKGVRTTSPVDSPCLEHPAVVSTDSGDVDGFPLTSTQGGLGDISNREGVYHASQSVHSGFLIKCVYGTYTKYISLHYMAICIDSTDRVHI